MVIVCTKCELQMRPAKTGQPVELMTTDGPYQFSMGDKYACPGCGVEVISGLGKPIAEHYQPAYEVTRESFIATDGPLVRYWSNQREKRECLGEQLP